MMESSNLGVCGWPYEHFLDAKEVFLDGLNLADNESEWFDDSPKLGEVSLDGIQKALGVYEITVAGKVARVALAELSMGHHIIASNDVQISKVEVKK